MYLLALLEEDLHDLAVHAALYGNGVKRPYGTEPVEINRQIAFLRGSYGNGHTCVGITAAVAAATAGGRGGLRFMSAAPDEKAARQSSDQKKNANPPSRRSLLTRFVLRILGMERERDFGARGGFCSFFVHEPLKSLSLAILRFRSRPGERLEPHPSLRIKPSATVTR